MVWLANSRQAFTLIEVLLALFILSIITVTVWRTFSNAFAIQEKLVVIEEKVHSSRSLLRQMDKDLTSFFFSKDKKFHTSFILNDNDLFDEVSFSTLNSRNFVGDRLMGDQVYVSYYTKQNRDDPDLYDVYRAVQPVLTREELRIEQQGISIVEGVSRFEISAIEKFADPWKKSWDSTRLDESGKAPIAVRVDLELADGQRLIDIFRIRLNQPIGGNALSSKPPANNNNNNNSGGAGIPTTAAPTGDSQQGDADQNPGGDS